MAAGGSAWSGAQRPPDWARIHASTRVVSAPGDCRRRGMASETAPRLTWPFRPGYNGFPEKQREVPAMNRTIGRFLILGVVGLALSLGGRSTAEAQWSWWDGGYYNYGVGYAPYAYGYGYSPYSTNYWPSQYYVGYGSYSLWPGSCCGGCGTCGGGCGSSCGSCCGISSYCSSGCCGAGSCGGGCGVASCGGGCGSGCGLACAPSCGCSGGCGVSGSSGCGATGRLGSPNQFPMANSSRARTIRTPRRGPTSGLTQAGFAVVGRRPGGSSASRRRCRHGGRSCSRDRTGGDGAKPAPGAAAQRQLRYAGD